MNVVLIPCGATDWRAQGRLLGRVELSLSQAAVEQFPAWREALRAAGVNRLLHAPDELSVETARALGEELDVTPKPASALHEVDLGLWAGLTEEQLRTRYASAHRELKDAPLNVAPPNGETLQDARERIQKALKKKLTNGGAVFGLVLRPFALGLARMVLEGNGAERFWSTVLELDAPLVIEAHANAPSTVKL